MASNDQNTVQKAIRFPISHCSQDQRKKSNSVEKKEPKALRKSNDIMRKDYKSKYNTSNVSVYHNIDKTTVDFPDELQSKRKKCDQQSNTTKDLSMMTYVKLIVLVLKNTYGSYKVDWL